MECTLSLTEPPLPTPRSSGELIRIGMKSKLQLCMRRRERIAVHSSCCFRSTNILFSVYATPVNSLLSSSDDAGNSLLFDSHFAWTLVLTVNGHVHVVKSGGSFWCLLRVSDLICLLLSLDNRNQASRTPSLAFPSR